MDKTMRCTTEARSAGPSDFYFSPGKINRGHRYLCHFSASPVSATLLPERSRFPEGITFTSTRNDYRFPLQLKIDAGKMIRSGADINFAYAVSPSDMPGDIQASCHQID